MLPTAANVAGDERGAFCQGRGAVMRPPSEPNPLPAGRTEILRGASWEIVDGSGAIESRLVLAPGPARFERWSGRELLARLVLSPSEVDGITARFEAGQQADHPTTEDVSFACSSTLTIHDGAQRRRLSVGNGVFSGGPIVALLDALEARVREAPPRPV